MADFTYTLLSGSTNGQPIKVTQTATAGTTIHTAHATSIDQVYLYASNTHTADVLLTIEWGGVTDPDNLIVQNIPFDDGLYLVIPGLPLTNSLLVRAFAGTANVINITGHVDRIG